MGNNERYIEVEKIDNEKLAILDCKIWIKSIVPIRLHIGESKEQIN
jgi:hypothetical protein